MIIISGRNRKLQNEGGFTFLELVIVIAVISVLAVVLLDRYYKLLVDVERTSMEHDLGVMRSAIGIQVAGHFVSGNLTGLQNLIGSNPMELLAERPNNYAGLVGAQKGEDGAKGSWVFDDKTGVLIYRVRNRLYFQSEKADSKRARFKIFPVYSDRMEKGKKVKYISGLTLRELESYTWLRPWE